ncbi:MAG TPA: alpha/beta hydrolase [Sphingomonas sp.]
MKIDRRALLGTLAIAAAPAPKPPPGQAAGPPDTADKPARLLPTRAIPHKSVDETIPLWPGFPPGTPPDPTLPAPTLRRAGAGGGREYRLKGVAAPGLSVYRPKQPNGVGLIVMPGGGYAFLSVENEGSAPAAFYTNAGYTVFVLSYRLPAEGWTDRADAPIQDALRAIRLVRARAADFHLDPKRIGIMGFSAGGHVAASLATDYATPLYEPIDAIDRESTRPAFVGLLYAVTTMRPLETHSVSRANLLGPGPDNALVARRSPLLHVGKATPPCFVACALDDGIVPPSCSLDWIAACRAAGVPVEGHVFEQGGHGFGLRLPSGNSGALWPQLFLLWARRHGG